MYPRNPYALRIQKMYMNQRWVIDYDPMLIRFGSNILKIVAVLGELMRENFGRPEVGLV